MSETAANSNRKTPTPRGGAGNRIDPAHAAAREASPEMPRLAVPSDAAGLDLSDPSLEMIGQLRTQATQLSQYLGSQQSDLDRREAELNARLAAMESELRSARLWFDERQQQLAEREAATVRGEAALAARLKTLDEPGVAPADWTERNTELLAREAEIEQRESALQQQTERLAQLRAEVDERHHELDQRQARVYQDIEEHCHQRARLGSEQAALEEVRAEIAASRVELDAWRKDIAHKTLEMDAERRELLLLRSDLDQQLDDLALREEKLRERHLEIETALKRFERLGVTEQRLEELQAQTGEYFQRLQYVEEAEHLLLAQEEDLRNTQRRLQLERDRMEDEARRAQRKVLEEQKAARVEIEQEKEALRRRGDQLDQRAAALEELQLELSTTQRETLEMRLATEEIWAQLSGHLAPASLSRSIGQIRSQLADHYRHVEQEMEQRRDELQALTESLARQRTKLVEQRKETDQWIQRRQAEIEQQASRLVAREQELDRQEAHFQQVQVRWDEERHGYQREIRQLLGKLRAPAEVGS